MPFHRAQARSKFHLDTDLEKRSTGAWTERDSKATSLTKKQLAANSCGELFWLKIFVVDNSQLITKDFVAGFTAFVGGIEN